MKETMKTQTCRVRAIAKPKMVRTSKRRQRYMVPFRHVRRTRSCSDLGGHRCRPKFPPGWTGGSRKDDAESPALGLVCKAMDQLGGNENDKDEVLAGPKETTKRPRQHSQYVGGSGGTGKSWVIKAMQTVLSIKSAQRVVITAISGMAAVGIGGNTIHSAIGLTFKDRDDQIQDNMPHERCKQRW